MLGHAQEDSDDYPEPIRIIVPIYMIYFILLNELFL